MIWKNLEVRTKILRAIREVFWSWGFREVDTPLLVARPGQEPYLQPFQTTVCDVVGRKFSSHLITSPEYALKKILARAANGEVPEFSKIFQLSHVFRNGEDWGGTHNPEFMMLEWYRLGEDYNALMDDVENLVCELVARIRALERFRNRIINFERPWMRMTVNQAFQKFAGRDDAFELAKNTDEFFKVFLNEVEPKIRVLDRPLHLVDYPIEQAALARRKPDDSRVAERVETYIAGLELTNGFSELTDVVEQRARFAAEQQERITLGQKPFPIDEEYLAALSPIATAGGAAGISLGVDRLLMLLLDATDINDVLFFSAKDIFEI